MLTGLFTASTKFGKDDHRNFNREGKAFDKGETFSGINYELGLKAVQELKSLFPDLSNLAPVALKWILQHKEISCVIPGASKPEHIITNLSAYNLPELSEKQISDMNEIYTRLLKPEVHQRW